MLEHDSLITNVPGENLSSMFSMPDPLVQHGPILLTLQRISSGNAQITAVHISGYSSSWSWSLLPYLIMYRSSFIWLAAAAVFLCSQDELDGLCYDLHLTLSRAGLAY